MSHHLTSPASEKLQLSPDDYSQDTKNVLIDRLNDLVVLLLNVSSLEDGAVAAIHREVDTIEILVNGVEMLNSPKELTRQNSGCLNASDDDFWGPPTPTQNNKMRTPALSQQSSPRTVFEPIASKIYEVAEAAEELSAQLSSTAAQLLVRKEESDRIHDLLATRAERAAERILILEHRMAEMDDDYQSSQSKLKFLRIQLQAIQVQCMNCIHRHDDDPELTDSIKNWKIDWEDINRRAKARRPNSHVPLIHQMSKPPTTVGSLTGS